MRKFRNCICGHLAEDHVYEYGIPAEMCKAKYLEFDSYVDGCYEYKEKELTIDDLVDELRNNEQQTKKTPYAYFLDDSQTYQ